MFSRLTLTFSSFALTVVAAIGLSISARAATIPIVNDTWLDATRTDPASPTYSEFGTDTDLDGNIESAWYTTNTANPGGTTVSAGHLVLANVASSTSHTTFFTAEGSEINLANAGNFIKVTWEFTPHAATAQANTSQNFRIALVDTPAAAPRITTDAPPSSGAYTGYAMFMNMSIATAAMPVENLGNSNPFRLMRRNVANSDLLGTSGNWLGIGTTGAAAGNHGYDSGTKYTFTMLVTRNGSNGLDFDVSMVGGTLNNTGTAQVLFTDTTPSPLGGFKFDTFAIRPSGNATTADDFDTTLFKVESNVPEPAALVLMGLGSFGLLWAARRRS